MMFQQTSDDLDKQLQDAIEGFSSLGTMARLILSILSTRVEGAMPLNTVTCGEEMMGKLRDIACSWDSCLKQVTSVEF